MTVFHVEVVGGLSRKKLKAIVLKVQMASPQMVISRRGASALAVDDLRFHRRTSVILRMFLTSWSDLLPDTLGGGNCTRVCGILATPRGALGLAGERDGSDGDLKVPTN